MGKDDKLALAVAQQRLGQVVDNKYRLTSIIGLGGMGIVYEARHEVMNRLVALKVLRPAYADRQKEFQRFLKEVRIIGSLGHSSIVRVFDAGFMDGTTPYFVMERLVGEDMRFMIAERGNLSIRRTAWIAYEVLRGLHVAHKAGVIHCDLKPANVFIHQRPEMAAPVVKMLDFGMSTIIAPDNDIGHQASKRRGAGTPYYMAPEQIRGESVTPRTDLWAVGTIVYEGLTGRTPFSGKNRKDLFDKILHTELRRPEERSSQPIPSEFSDLVMSLLEKDAERRPASAKEVASRLSELGLVDVEVRTSIQEGARPPMARPYHTATFRRLNKKDKS